MTQVGDRLEHAIEQRSEPVEPERRSGPKLRRTIFWLAVTGVSLYLVAPSLIETFGSWDELNDLSPWWLVAMAVLQACALGCLWVLQRLALHVKRWSPVVLSQLAGNAMSKIAPGGGAMGAALQYRMLVQAGVPSASVASALTAVNLLTFGVVLAMPVLAIPAFIRGGVSRDLLEIAAVGIVVAVVLSVVGTILIATDGPLAWIGRVIQRARNRIRRGAEPLRRLPERLLRERDRIVGVLGPRWKRALVATVGRWAFDYMSLLAALAAIGSHPRPSLVLLAFCGAQVLAQIPITPGGLGFVEAGLTAMLTLAGVGAGNAVVATFAYRLFSYWLPLPVGLAAYGWYVRRYGGGRGDRRLDTKAVGEA
jgi:uncharacterized protein (TIRG00374 family)